MPAKHAKGRENWRTGDVGTELNIEGDNAMRAITGRILTLDVCVGDDARGSGRRNGVSAIGANQLEQETVNRIAILGTAVRMG